MVASCRNSTSVAGVRKLLSNAVSSAGASDSEIEVKSRMSENMMVISRNSPP